MRLPRGERLASDKSGDRTILRCRPIPEIEGRFVDVAPAPALRRIVALDDRMPGGVEVGGGVPAGRLVAAADMAAGAADPQMQPLASALQALLAAERTRRDVLDAGDVAAAF